MMIQKKRLSVLVLTSLQLLFFFYFVPSCSMDLTDDQPTPGQATTYYVATNGDDSSNGLHPSSQGGANGPFFSIARAVRAVKPGDSVEIRAGVYQEASTWTTNGTETRPITITNFNGETVVINGDNNTIPPGTYGVLLQIRGNWYRVSNLEISYSSWYGLLVSGDHCTVDNVYVHHNWGSGITLTGWYGLVQNCRAYNNSLQNEYYRPHTDGTWSTGITACRSPQYSTIRQNIAWDNWGQGISTYESSHITIEDNVSYNNQQNFYISDTKYALVQRNLSYFTPGNMIQDYETQNSILMGDERYNPPSSDNTVINNLCIGGERNISIGREVFENGLVANNTFVNASETAGSESANVRIGPGNYKNARFMNNIVFQENAVELCQFEATGVSFGYNNWSKSPASDCQGPGDVVGDPRLFRTGPTGPGSLTPEWFKILASSPVRDRAKILREVTEDFFKTPRGSSPDIGAFEIPTLLTASLESRMFFNLPLFKNASVRTSRNFPLLMRFL